MLEEVFLPVSIQGLHNHPIDWHTKSSFPDAGQAKLLVFGVTDKPEILTDFPVCRALRDLVWNVSNGTKIAHLGVFVDNDKGAGLAKLIDFLHKRYSQARLLIYGLRGNETELTSLVLNFKQLTFFVPELGKDYFRLIPEIISSLKFDHIVLAGVQQYLTGHDYQKLASYPRIDLWYLRDLDNEQIEVVERHAGLIWVDYRVLARSVTGSEILPHPAGMDIKQWAALFYYAGISLANRLTVISHVDLDNIFHVDSEVMAVGIWHFFEGMKNKIKDYPLLSIQNLEKTEVYVHDYRTFLYHNAQTGRWWIEVPDSERGTKLHPLSSRVAMDVIEGRNSDLLLKFW